MYQEDNNIKKLNSIKGDGKPKKPKKKTEEQLFEIKKVIKK